MHILVLAWLKGKPVGVPIGHGGIERMSATLTRELLRQGHKVTLVAPPGSAIEGATVVETDDFTQALETIRFSRADVVLDNSCWSLDSPVRHPLPMRAVSITHVNHAIGWSQNVCYLSCSQRTQHGLQLGRDLSKAPVIRVPTDPALKPLGLARDTFLLYLGFVAEWKGVHHAAEVAQELGKELIVAGPAAGTYAEQLRAMPNVKMIGEVQDPLRSHLLEQASAVMCLHNNSNGWIEPGAGIIGEAGAFNTPVAAFPNGVLGEIVVTGDNGWLANDVKSMVRLMRDTPTLPDAGRLAREEWNAEKITQQYVTLLEQVCNGLTWN